MLRKILLSFWIVIVSVSLTFAGKLQMVSIGDFPLQNGQVIQDCKIGFRVFGKMNSQKTNVILFPTWFGGSSEHLGRLIGPDKLIDSTKFCIIAIDALGNGISSSPSNSPQQPNEQFPLFTITDMVRSQHLLVSQYLNLKHVYAIIGGSMGGMQTFEWIVRYPNFMDKAIPYVGSPKVSANDYLLWNQALKILTIGWRYHVPADSIRGMLEALLALTMRTPQWITEHWSIDDVQKQFATFYQGENQRFSNYNFAAQIKAMLRHDVTKIENGDWQKTADRVKAKTLVIVSQTDHVVNPQNALKFARLIKAQTFVLNDPCGHLAIGCNLSRVAQQIKRFLEGQ